MEYNTSYIFQYSDDGDLVYFIVNVNQLFNINLSYPGVLTAIKKAFDESKRYIPFKTGLLKKSYSMKRINNDSIMIFFDPAKLLGKKRLGKMNKTYYAKYLKEHTKTFNWLDIIMKNFYDRLLRLIRIIEKKSKKNNTLGNLTTAAAILFYSDFLKKYKEKLEAFKKEQRSV
jgi:hypothetical protein